MARSGDLLSLLWLSPSELLDGRLMVDNTLFGLARPDIRKVPQLGSEGSKSLLHYRPKASKVEIYAKAIQGLLSLEPDWNRRRKYVDFVDIYTDLTDNERQHYEQEYQRENDEMAGFAERFTNIGLERGLEKGREEGREEGRRQEAVTMLTRFLTKRFGPLDEVTQERVNNASVEQLEAWSDRVLDAEALAEVFE